MADGLWLQLHPYKAKFRNYSHRVMGDLIPAWGIAVLAIGCSIISAILTYCCVYGITHVPAQRMAKLFPWCSFCFRGAYHPYHVAVTACFMFIFIAIVSLVELVAVGIVIGVVLGLGTFGSYLRCLHMKYTNQLYLLWY